MHNPASLLSLVTADSSVVAGAIPGNCSVLVFLKTLMSLQPFSQQIVKEEDQSLGPEKRSL